MKAPYSDPALVRRPAVYADFLHQLHARGMVRWTTAYGQRGRLGIFFVRKKSGALRLTFDTRNANLYFHDAPSSPLQAVSVDSSWNRGPPSILVARTLTTHSTASVYLLVWPISSRCLPSLRAPSAYRLPGRCRPPCPYVRRSSPSLRSFRWGGLGPCTSVKVL